jgi:hypothetical protein
MGAQYDGVLRHAVEDCNPCQPHGYAMFHRVAFQVFVS